MSDHPFEPIDRLYSRIDRERQESDAALLQSLLYAGEMILKMAVAGMVACVADDRERHRYRHLYQLVRQGAVGAWSSELDQILTGPTSQHIFGAARVEQRELTQKHTEPGTWQYDSAKKMHRCARIANPDMEPLPGRLYGRSWFSYFPPLRNKTRGHGATTPDEAHQIAPILEDSIRLFADNFNLFQRPWANLRRNHSGKYNVSNISPDEENEFYPLSTNQGKSVNLDDGVYVWMDRWAKVDLVESNSNLDDFYVPNGDAGGDTFELRSFITNSTKEGNLDPYTRPPEDLPSSETEGAESLLVRRETFSNAPQPPTGYIERSTLEDELLTALEHREISPIVTLTGRGGIGKTSLALHVIDHLTERDRFDAILWFSARDIDLLQEGPRPVKPRVITKHDISQTYCDLLYEDTGGDPKERFEEELNQGIPLGDENGGELLAVFDNFETVRNPSDLYSWIHTHVRLPNKVLITTRTRDFRGDFPIEVQGMDEEQSRELIESTASRLGILNILTGSYKRDLLDQADGHPYIIKILLGEVAKEGQTVSIEHVVADQDEMLTALFERNYRDLSPLAKRVFLTLCSWKSVVPQLAIRAVLLRSSNDTINVKKAIDELEKSSFIEITVSEEDTQPFITVPLSAAVFGREKISVSPYKAEVEVDSKLLQDFGAAQKTDIQHGVSPRVERFFKNVRERVGDDEEEFSEYVPMLEFIARRYSPAWMLLADLHEKYGEYGSDEQAMRAVRMYLQDPPPDGDIEAGWKRLTRLAQKVGDVQSELQALVELATLPSASTETVSEAANEVNRLLHENDSPVQGEESRILLRSISEALKQRSHELDADGFSRLAWIRLYIDDEPGAIEATKMGLEEDPYNEHCLKLAESLGIDQ